MASDTVNSWLSNRGFRQIEELPLSQGGSFHVYESSNVDPSVWIKVKDFVTGEEVTISVGLDELATIIAQLTILHELHYSHER